MAWMLSVVAAPSPAATPGVDVEQGVVRLGVLNDLSGPGAAIGRPWAVGKRVLAQQVNSGRSKLLPRGWTIQLVERDHQFELARARDAYGSMRKDVLFLLGSFGSSINDALLPALRTDDMVAFPGSLDSSLDREPLLPLLGTSYRDEARRGFDWIMYGSEPEPVVRPAIVYRDDRYGRDGYSGWASAAAQYGVELAAELALDTTDIDAADIVVQLRESGATHVMLSTLPDTTGRLLAAAAADGYAPIWLGNTAAWSDLFFDPRVAQASWFSQFYWITGFPWWGEDHPLMSEFLDAFLAYGSNPAAENFYVLLSWLQGRVALQALGAMLRDGEYSRAAYRIRLQHLVHGFEQPEVAAALAGLRPGEARILRPVVEMGSWQVMADYAEPVAADQGDSSQVRK